MIYEIKRYYMHAFKIKVSFTFAKLYTWIKHEETIVLYNNYLKLGRNFMLCLIN